MTLPAHSHVGASSADRWMNCPGSVRLSENIASSTSLYAAEGTAAHWVAEMTFGGANVNNLLGAQRHIDGHVVEVTEEMIEHASAYAEYVRRLAGNDGDIVVEHKFHLESLHPGLFGTADAVVWKPADATLHVIDFKYGQGVSVNPDGRQLRYYALGALLESGHPAKTVVLHIYQPRLPFGDVPYRVHELDAVDLIDFAADLVEAVEATEAPDAPLAAGDWCKWCPAAPTCPELHDKAQMAARMEFSEEKPLSLVDLGEAMRQVPLIEGWCKRVREAAYEQAMAGKRVPGHKLVEKRATRKWRDENAAKAALEGYDGVMEVKLRSPAQVEKVLKGVENAAEKLDALTTKESTGLTLVPDSDKRPEYERPSAQDDFNVTNEDTAP